jgi:hypothetical protein
MRCAAFLPAKRKISGKSEQFCSQSGGMALRGYEPGGFFAERVWMVRRFLIPDPY